MVTYKTASGKVYDISAFSQQERECYDWLIEEAKVCTSWMEFYPRTERGTINCAKKVARDEWLDHPLRYIQLDLNQYLMVKYKEARGEPRELSDIITE
tara:strand:- start:16340 stop:16633 length:294 start_codon:yes stop_codon:yes gene_type:complete